MDDWTEQRTDFLTALAERALGVAQQVRPRLRPRFSSTRPVGGPLTEALRREPVGPAEASGFDPGFSPGSDPGPDPEVDPDGEPGTGGIG